MNMDHYYLYREIVSALEGFVRTYPELCDLYSIGETYEGRFIWCLTVCNEKTGAAHEKAAFFMDGNLHSGEVASSMAVLYTLDKWLSSYGKDPEITGLLDRYTVYAIPRISADAAEIYLTTPRTLRGSTEKYYPEESGIVPCDVDGDGTVRQMRILDPAGKWKVWEKNPDVMVPRQPDDISGRFYTLVSEGEFRGDPKDSVNLRDARPQEDLDPNRQFPFEWNMDYPDPDRPTSGPEPLHDREVQALYHFVCDHPNIVFHMNFHTYGGLHISPAAFCPHLDAPDGEAMRRLGLAMRKKTGYKCEGIFPPGARDIAPGSYTAWEYFAKGIMAFVTELWDFHFQADPERPEQWSMFAAESEEQFLREAETAIRWDRENNGGQGFKSWKPFDHWQLDEVGNHVEIGGWCDKFSRQNPPVHLLSGVCEKGCQAALTGFKALPRPEILSVGLRRQENGTETVTVEIGNLGFLPTSGTENAFRKKLDCALTVTLGGCRMISENPVHIDKIDGFSKARAVFTVNIPEETDLTVTLRGQRCGTAKAAVHIKGGVIGHVSP